MMDLKQYLAPLKKWWWLVVIAVVVAAGSAYQVVKNEPNIYQAHATLMIGNVVQDPNPNAAEFYMAQQLAVTYADIANREQVQNATKKALNMTWLPEYHAAAAPNTSLIEVLVNDSNPQLAQTVANEIANQIIQVSPNGQNAAEQQRQQFVIEQLDKLEPQIIAAQGEIERLTNELATLDGAVQIADMREQIAAQEQKLQSLQASYASLLATSQERATNAITIIQPAALPERPVGPNRQLVIMLSAAIALVLSTVTAYAIEIFDDTIKDMDEVSQILKLPILAYIGRIPKDCKKAFYIWQEPNSPISDNIRMLRMNLELLAHERPFKVILISSPNPGDGKSTIASNLAASFALSGKKVIFVDADMRKPTIHRELVNQSNKGLSDIILGSIELENALIPWGDLNLRIITAGTPPPNPAELLNSPRMDQTIEKLKRMADIIILDCPPTFMVDTVTLAGKIDRMLLVLRHGQTHRKTTAKIIEPLRLSGTNIIGIVVNQTPPSESYYSVYRTYNAYNQPRKNGKAARPETEPEEKLAGPGRY